MKYYRLFLTHILSIFFSWLPQHTSAEESQFGVPFDFPLFLSGNFGELRSNHFHGGLDFKTQGTVGKPLLAIADGYISKVSVTAGGYGNALYITHDNGYTSVHGHLDRFLPEIAKLVRQKQYEEQTFATTLVFNPNEFRVRQGDVVAYAGNTGYSFGPHLHMEIRKTSTDEPIDPLPFYKNQITDNIAPRATHIMVYGSSQGKVKNNTPSTKGILETEGKIIFNTRHSSLNSIIAWGRIGTAISANDYMDGTHNNYGVRYVRLYVDNKLISSSDVNRFSFNENRLINSWTDHTEYRRSGRWYMRSTIAQNNNLRMLHADSNNGWITINEERDYHFRYELEDLHGNSSTYHFIVHGKRMELPFSLPNYNYYMDASSNNRFYTQGVELWIPQGALFDDVELDYEVIPSEKDQAHHYRFTQAIVPLRYAAEITLPTLKDNHIEASQLYIARVNGKHRVYCGGTYKFGHITTDITALGTYTVCADTVAPKVNPIGETTWKKRGVIAFHISDSETGIHSYRGMIDGRWVLFKYSSKNARLWCDLKAEGITHGRHKVEIVVTDMRKNVNRQVMNIEL